MKKILVAICGFIVLSSLTSCLDVIEKLVINSNGSGHFTRTLDMSEMTEMLNGLKDTKKDPKSDEPEAPKDMDPNSLGETMKEDVEVLKSVNGISNVRSTSDTIKGIYTLEFDFVNDAALNDALNKTGDKKEKAESVYSIKGSTVTLSDHNMMKEFEESSDMGEEANELAKGMMDEMKYHLTITLPGVIKSVNNKKAEISDDKKSITIDATVKELSEKKVTTGMKIIYK